MSFNSRTVTSQVYSTSQMRGKCLTLPAKKNQRSFWSAVFVQKNTVTYGGMNPGTETFTGKFNFTAAMAGRKSVNTLVGTRIQSLIITDEFLRTVFVVRDGHVQYDMGVIGTETISEIKGLLSV